MPMASVEALRQMHTISWHSSPKSYTSSTLKAEAHLANSVPRPSHQAEPSGVDSMIMSLLTLPSRVIPVRLCLCCQRKRTLRLYSKLTSHTSIRGSRLYMRQDSAVDFASPETTNLYWQCYMPWSFLRQDSYLMKMLRPNCSARTSKEASPVIGSCRPR